VALREVTCPTAPQWAVVLKGPSYQLGMEYVCNEGDNAPLFMTVKSRGKPSPVETQLCWQAMCCLPTNAAVPRTADCNRKEILGIDTTLGILAY